MHVYGVLSMLLVGLVAGWLAHKITGGRGSLLSNLITSLIGSVIGGMLASLLGFYWFGIVGSILVSTLGAVILLALFDASRRKSV
jgi:uncharacterized membrane protein YeaQ/YmgE (transglycosylase-associated protein family)